MSCPTRCHAIPTVALWLALMMSAEARGDRIILRSLKIISDRTVTSFDDDGVNLDDRSRLAWDEIEKATVAADKQAAFDKLLAEVGGPLFRIRQRLANADYEGALQPAEALYPRFARSPSDTAYLVAQALMWGRVAAGRREESIVPYLRCIEWVQAKSKPPTLPGDRRLRFDPQTGLSPDLLPLWLNEEAAKRVLPEVFQRVAQLPKPRPEGAYLYYASLALSAGDEPAATKALGAVKSNLPAIAELRMILDAQRETLAKQPGVGIALLETKVPSFSSTFRPLALYWLGTSKLHSTDVDRQRAGMLQLLRIPALYGPEQPEVAGAALHQVFQSLTAAKDASGSAAVRRELLERYGQTYSARKLNAQ